MVRKANVITMEALQGGRGSAEIHMIVPKEELYNSASMYAKVVLQPGSSVGWHTHTGETEPYYILEGEGIFIDNDGSRTPVSAGDVCTIIPGQSHSIENVSDTETLSFMALIYNDLR
jgi:quercetin dioxygenase-like cupin family protein